MVASPSFTHLMLNDWTPFLGRTTSVPERFTVQSNSLGTTGTRSADSAEAPLSNADTPFSLNGQAPATDVPARLRNTFWQRIWCVKVFYRSLLGVAQALGRTGLSPNIITLSSLAISVGVAVSLTVGAFVVGAALLVLSGVFDILDGAVARITGQSSRWGALLDSSVDRIADALPLSALVLYYAPNKWAQLPLLVSLILGFAISYVRARAESLDVTLPSMFMRRAERLLMLVACLLLGTIDWPTLDSAFGLPHAPMFAGLCVTALLHALGLGAVFYVAHQKLKLPPVASREANEGVELAVLPPVRAPQS
jgi:phosphatidylglycerophosphate synthase